MVFVEESEVRETSPGRCERASTAGLFGRILEAAVEGVVVAEEEEWWEELSRRLAREGLLLKVSLAGDAESEVGAGSASGREVIIINWNLARCSERPWP